MTLRATATWSQMPSARAIASTVFQSRGRSGRPLRCLPRAIVLYSLLVEEGYDARIAIGLPEVSSSIDAHAWVEVKGEM